ncbi:conserved membrane hypothetical protein [Clostridium neonatale]|uniref:glycosyltransferase family 39 protein n=1 Tax=Clostridium neonatale TaxID=137838 RepID=UPI00291B56A7|nr:glycosyltransferase family 39 protein [Clostridium neonatale]CAI3633178.1 conserved membrane hypothetical protein [Clostridium neonatale]
MNKREKVYENIFILFCFIIFTIWVVVQPFNSCPDEAMRYDVIKYVFDYNKLPHGGQESLLNPIWGFSYAFLPYLSGLVSVAIMKIISLFTMNEQMLVIAARMASVCFGVVTVYYIIKISNKLFDNIYKWFFIILVSCLPQFVFLSSYMNNDILALMSVVLIIYYWIDGHENKWNMKSNIGLAVSVAICALSYYNAYPFILFSIVFFIWSNFSLKLNRKEIGKKFIFISVIVLILSGWWFIRNAILYNGDFLGMNTMTEYSNMYAREDIKPINHLTPEKEGISVLSMLIDREWLKTTYKSFIGVFGYMQFPMKSWTYKFYACIIAIGIVCFIVSLFKLKEISRSKSVIFLFMTLASLITICLSIYRSYTVDFQAQGRYIIECLIPLAIFVTEGFKYITEVLDNKVRYMVRNSIVIISGICILISISCLFMIIIPAYK